MLSFIVPAYNEELELPTTIAAIHQAATESDRGYEIIVVDDASTDQTPEIAIRLGARVVPVRRRQIAAARNAGAQAARGDILFFVDADTRITARHVSLALAALTAGCSGGSARIEMDGDVPRWAKIFLALFSAIYFNARLGAGAFLFTSRRNFARAGGFDEQYFAAEETYFSIALKEFGPFEILREPVITSGRKIRMHSAWHVLGKSLAMMLGGPNALRARDKLDLWYDGRREERAA